MKEPLLGKTLAQIEDIVAANSMPRFAAKQIAEWLYKKQATSIEEMTNLSLKNRNTLSERYCVGLSAPTDLQTSVDGTKKYLYHTLQNKPIEAAYIPDRERATLCVSSQAGCRMGCKFCMTARQGFQQNLSSGEIINQIASLPERDTLTNIVYMGMGEPLDNIENVMQSLEVITADWGYAWSPTRVTLSTIGVLPALTHFLEHSKVHLAVSLHNPFEDERLEIMPAQNAHKLSQTIAAVKQYDFSHQRRVSFEYIMFAGINDSPRHVKELIRILNGVKARVNLIRFHAIPDSTLRGSDEKTMVAFRDALNTKGVLATIRSSRGEDIFAACGMLSTASLLGGANKEI